MFLMVGERISSTKGKVKAVDRDQSNHLPAVPGDAAAAAGDAAGTAVAPGDAAAVAGDGTGAAAAAGDAAGTAAVAGDAAGAAVAPGNAADAVAQPSRRQVLYSAGAGLGLAALAPVLRPGSRPAGATGKGARVAARATADRCMDFGQDWKFVLVNPNVTNDPTGAYGNAYQPGFDDSNWQAVDVPHDWAIYLTPVDLPGTSSGTGPLARPATIAVSHWNGREFVPVRNLAIDWATGSNQPTTLTFDPVRSSQLRLDMTSAAPGTGGGFLMIAELQARGGGVKIG
jgi:hypothetical protein